MSEIKNALYITQQLIVTTRMINFEIMSRQESFEKVELINTNAFICYVMDSIHNLPIYAMNNDNDAIVSEYVHIKKLEEKVEKIAHMHCYFYVKSEIESLLERINLEE